MMIEIPGDLLTTLIQLFRYASRRPSLRTDQSVKLQLDVELTAFVWLKGQVTKQKLIIKFIIFIAKSVFLMFYSF